MLVIKDLVKTYASGVQALKGVSLDLSPGVFGLLGPNGSLTWLLAAIYFAARTLTRMSRPRTPRI